MVYDLTEKECRVNFGEEKQDLRGWFIYDSYLEPGMNIKIRIEGEERSTVVKGCTYEYSPETSKREWMIEVSGIHSRNESNWGLGGQNG